MPPFAITKYQPTPQGLTELATLLHANVDDGASVSFVLPFTLEDATDWWQTKVLPDPKRILLVATQNNEIVGSVQLLLDTPPNQPHRADVAKLLVHPKARRQGIARALMLALEAEARLHHRTLLTLDTVTGSAAEPLYLSLGFTLSGHIPAYASNTTQTTLESTTIFYKHLTP
jgi:GNAT superfamily N-acetyltransferase